MNSQSLAGRVALVAGATRGAGRGCARALAAAGAFVYCTGRSVNGQAGGLDRPETINETVAIIEADGGRAVAVQVDHTDEVAVAQLAERVQTESGQLDILVNSIWGADADIGWGKTFWEVDLGEVNGYLDQTLTSHLLTNRHLAPMMVEAGRGLIIEMIDGHYAGYRGQILYDLVKAALSRLAYGMAMELVGKGVTALALSPGFLRSEAVLEHFGVAEENWRDAIAVDPYFAESESPLFVGRAAAALAADPDVTQKSGLSWFACDLAREYGFTDADGRVPDFPSRFDSTVRQMAENSPLSPEDRFYVWSRYCQIHREAAKSDLASQLAQALGVEGLGPGLAPAQKPD